MGGSENGGSAVARSPRPARRKQTPWRRRFRRARRRAGSVAIPILAPSFLRTLSRSWKVTEIGREGFDRGMESPGRLVTLWHGRMVLPLPMHGEAGHKVLVSPSEDGQLVVPLLKKFGYGAIRGSSNKNPMRALREMLGQLEVGGTIVITPDGPRGPRHSVNQGAAWMARATGYPILPTGCVCDRAWRLNSWDRFTIPRFGARVCLVYAEPLWVDKKESDAGVEAVTEEMRRRMIEAEERGFRELGIEKDW